MTTRRLLEQVACGRLSSGGARAMLDKMDREKRERRKRTAPKRADRVRAKEERKATRRENMAAIRALVVERAGGRCEVCGADSAHVACEAHHLVAGGLRRHRESVETVILLCLDCHRAYHRSDVTVMYEVRGWAKSLGYTQAAAEVERRIDKVEAMHGVF